MFKRKVVTLNTLEDVTKEIRKTNVMYYVSAVPFLVGLGGLVSSMFRRGQLGVIKEVYEQAQK